MKWAYSEPGDRREERADHERQQARLHDPDPDRLGGHPVLALGEHLAAVGRALDPPDDVDRHDGPDPRPPQVGVRGDVRERPRAARERVGVEQDDPDDDQEAERRDRDEMPRQAHQHPPDEPGDRRATRTPAISVASKEADRDRPELLVEVDAGQPAGQVRQVGSPSRAAAGSGSPRRRRPAP